MRHVFIVNPVAGKGDWQKTFIGNINLIMASSDDSWEIYETKNIGDGEEYCRNLATSTDELIRFYACGGDGTLSEVVNGVATLDNVEVAAYPAGSGNDFVKSLSKKASDKNIESLINSKAEYVDLIKVNDRYAINECNIGFDAMVAFGIDQFKKLPFVSGPAAYNLSLAKNFLSKTGYDFKIVVDDNEEFKEKFLLCVVANGKYYGSGYKAAPFASVNDGLLEVVMVKRIPRTKMAGWLDFYKKGEHLTNPDFKNDVIYRRVSKVTISSKTKVAMCIDGDSLVSNEFTMEVIPNKLKFVTPR